MPKKVFVEVTADFKADGEMLPRSFIWDDGRSYQSFSSLKLARINR
jgi:hypothetical protein